MLATGKYSFKFCFSVTLLFCIDQVAQQLEYRDGTRLNEYSKHFKGTEKLKSFAPCANQINTCLAFPKKNPDAENVENANSRTEAMFSHELPPAKRPRQ